MLDPGQPQPGNSFIIYMPISGTGCRRGLWRHRRGRSVLDFLQNKFVNQNANPTAPIAVSVMRNANGTSIANGRSAVKAKYVFEGRTFRPSQINEVHSYPTLICSNGVP